jgi:hypothetical protein
VLRLQSDGGGRSGLPCRGLSRWPDSEEEGIVKLDGSFESSNRESMAV